MKSVAIIACVLALSAPAVSAPAWAQSPATPQKVPEAPSMTSSAMTMAPVSPGSTKMHAVPTPSVEKRSTSRGTGQKLTGKGGN